MKLMFMVVFLLFNFGTFCYGGIFKNRVWNGTAVTDGKYPNVPRLLTPIYVQNNGTPHVFPAGLCTASVISPRHILTAAHCVNEFNETSGYSKLFDFILVDYGKLDPDYFQRLSEHGFATIFHAHEGWSASKYHINDIAIIEFKGGNLGIEPMLLPKNYEEGDDDIAITLGYGDTNNDPVDSTLPNTLVEAPIPVIKDCVWKTNKEASLICAGTKTTRVDYGDSGGPLVIEKDGKLYQIGVVQHGSFANGTLTDHFSDFGVYTRVSAYCDWIEKTTNSEVTCVDMPQSTNAPTQAPDPDAAPTVTPSALKDPSGGEMSYVYPFLLFISALIIAF